MHYQFVSVLHGVLLLGWIQTALSADVTVDCATVTGPIRRLHGVNNGPLNQGETVDVSRAWKELGIPITRLHDSEWPAGDLVDLHAVFPDSNADPDNPASYRFAKTDDYIQPIVATGSALVYRLGESIEHSRRKHHVHPPRDLERWARACAGIVRHYNQGWADGHRYGIRYWEIWNEPENRPAMWSGTDEDYFRLYVTTAKALKSEFPDIRVGGPAAGATGEFHDGRFVPTPFLQQFLKVCRAQSAPLEFFSWHIYTNEPAAVVRRAQALRAWLNQEGFTQTELHLNEWNYLPGNRWEPMLSSADPAARERWYADMGGLPGARFVASTLVALQDSPVDVANYYSGDTSPFGLFHRFGAPKRTADSVRAFQLVRQMGQRVAASSADPRERILAARNTDGTEIRLLVCHESAELAGSARIRNLPWTSPTELEIWQLHADREASSSRTQITVDNGTLNLPLPTTAVAVLMLRPAR